MASERGVSREIVVRVGSLELRSPEVVCAAFLLGSLRSIRSSGNMPGMDGDLASGVIGASVAVVLYAAGGYSARRATRRGQHVEWLTGYMAAGAEMARWGVNLSAARDAADSPPVLEAARTEYQAAKARYQASYLRARIVVPAALASQLTALHSELMVLTSSDGAASTATAVALAEQMATSLRSHYKL